MAARKKKPVTMYKAWVPSLKSRPVRASVSGDKLRIELPLGEKLEERIIPPPPPKPRPIKPEPIMKLFHAIPAVKPIDPAVLKSIRAQIFRMRQEAKKGKGVRMRPVHPWLVKIFPELPGELSRSTRAPKRVKLSATEIGRNKVEIRRLAQMYADLKARSREAELYQEFVRDFEVARGKQDWKTCKELAEKFLEFQHKIFEPKKKMSELMAESSELVKRMKDRINDFKVKRKGRIIEKPGLRTRMGGLLKKYREYYRAYTEQLRKRRKKAAKKAG